MIFHNYNLLFVKISALLFISLNVIGQQNKDLNFERVGINEGLSQNTITSILQDENGFVWIGTLDGLNRYDGVDFKIFSHDVQDTSSIIDNRIKILFEDSFGDLWIGTPSGLVFYDKNSEHFSNFVIGKEEKILSINEDKEKLLWIGTNKGLYFREKNSFKFKKVDLSSIKLPMEEEKVDIAHGEFFDSDENSITAIIPNKEGGIWLGTGKKGLIFYHHFNGKMEVFQKEANKNSIASNTIFDISNDSQGNLWMGTSGGVSFFNTSNLLFKNYQHDQDASGSLSNNLVFSIFVSSNGNVWAGPEGGGLSLLSIKDGNFINYKYNALDDHSLSNDDVYSIYETRDGILWIGTYNGGVNKYDPLRRKFKHTTVNPGAEYSLSSKSMRKLFQDEAGDLWVATVNAGLNRINQKTGEIQHFRENESKGNTLSSDRINVIIQDLQGNYWVGTASDGLDKLEIRKRKNGKETYSYTNFLPVSGQKNSLADAEIMDIKIDEKGMLWIGTYGGLSYLDPISHEISSFRPQPDQPDHNANKIRTVEVDGDSLVWIGTHGSGLFKFDRKSRSFTNYSNISGEKNSISSNAINVILKGKDNVLWIGTARGGLNKYNPVTNTFHHYTEKEGLANNYVYGILEDDNGYLWISTNNGISRLEKESGKFHNFHEKDGLQNEEFNMVSYHKNKDGRMYFGGINGFNSFHPAEVKLNPYKPKIAFTEFKVLNKVIAAGNESLLPKSITQIPEIQLNYTDYMFSFSFAGLQFSSPEENQYAYKMEGFNEDWIEIGNKRQATFTNLDPGEYTFRVKASNSDGIWDNEGAALKVNISPPWWSTLWFRLLAGLSIIVLGYSFYKYRTKQFLKRQIILEDQVKERTTEIHEKSEELQQQAEELKQQAEELEAQRDNLKDANSQLTTKNTLINNSINVALTIQQSILPSDKDLETAFSEIFTIYQPKDIVSGDFYWLGKVGRKNILAAVDCTGHGVPGAFMSLIGNNLLNEIVKQNNVIEPNEILNELQKNLSQNLSAHQQQMLHGMDVTIVSVEKLEKGDFSVAFAGAKRPLYYISTKKGELEEVKGNNKSISSGNCSSYQFDKTQLDLPDGSCLYIGSDGFVDQNDPGRKRFGSKRLKQVLNSNAKSPMPKQKEHLIQAFEAHKNSSSQRDDILLMGIRL